MSVRYLFTNCPDHVVDSQWFNQNQHLSLLSTLYPYLILDRNSMTWNLNDFLLLTENITDYGQFLFHSGLTEWAEFLSIVSRENPVCDKIEIHLFSEREQRPFYISFENNVAKIHGYSPYHVAFFDIFEVDMNNTISYEFNEEKYHSTYYRINPMETLSMHDLLDDIERFGVVVRT